MFVMHIILAVLAYCPIVALAAPTASAKAEGVQFAPPKNLADEIPPAKKLYSGPWSSFPAMNKWIAFDTMFNANTPSMFASGSTQQDVDRIRVAITSVGKTYGIDRRVLLGMMMEESHGGVGAVTTFDADGVPTGGLMQASSCHGYDGQKNLAQAEITYMVDCGTQHFKLNLGNWGNQNSEQTIYPAMREYNSGSVIASDLSTAPNGAGNPAYVSDVAQRLVGWVN
ncbi:hypothetical protein INS49_012773 [Diaporthe citri]|uniref:uncharacterized protein n=1 Tax=Diaporthe citri TaxID=83186 RepID=UPI001C7E6DD6|nr:uncharacterized protein INS49_012773 [Diaporthe citri]KAG6359252.1 hypothetical protein INS49_012773 [Diaporthe citri]